MRITKQSMAVRLLINEHGHISNQQLYELLNADSPNEILSKTTVHRITKRLHEHGEIGLAPRSIDGEVRYDAIAKPHHHFMCSTCGRLCDIPHDEAVSAALSVLKSYATLCAVGSSAVLMGVCIDCRKKDKEVS